MKIDDHVWRCMKADLGIILFFSLWAILLFPLSFADFDTVWGVIFFGVLPTFVIAFFIHWLICTAVAKQLEEDGYFDNDGHYAYGSSQKSYDDMDDSSDDDFDDMDDSSNDDFDDSSDDSDDDDAPDYFGNYNEYDRDISDDRRHRARGSANWTSREDWDCGNSHEDGMSGFDSYEDNDF